MMCPNCNVRAYEYHNGSSWCTKCRQEPLYTHTADDMWKSTQISRDAEIRSKEDK